MAADRQYVAAGPTAANRVVYLPAGVRRHIRPQLPVGPGFPRRDRNSALALHAVDTGGDRKRETGNPGAQTDAAAWNDRSRWPLAEIRLLQQRKELAMYRMIAAMLLGGLMAVCPACRGPVVSNSEGDSGENQPAATGADGGAPSEASDDVSSESESATPPRLAGEERDQYVGQMRKDIEALNETIQAISARVKTFSQKKQEQWQSTLDTLRAKRDGLEQKLNDVAEANARSWEDLRQGVEDAWTDFKRAVGEASRDLEREANQPDDKKSTSDNGAGAG